MSDSGVVGHASLQAAWKAAAALVRARPWLTISWVAHPGEGHHLVVHDGPHGPALHFDDDAGPTFAGEGGVSMLEWDDVSTPEDGLDWSAEWGPVDPEAESTPKVAAYALLSAFVAKGPAWSVQPARIVADEGDTLSAYALRQRFPGLAAAVETYTGLLEGQFREGEYAGRIEYWHEPLWLVSRDGVPFVVVDEAGGINLPDPPGERAATLIIETIVQGRARQGAAPATSGEGEVEEPEARRPPAGGGSRRPPLRVAIDLAAILSPKDFEILRDARERGLAPDAANLPWGVAREFADAFHEDWWGDGLPNAYMGVFEWTLHIGGHHTGPGRADLLHLAASDAFTGFFFAGFRLLVDRFGRVDCDVYITRSDDMIRVQSETPVDVIGVGSDEHPDWYVVQSYLSMRATRS